MRIFMIAMIVFFLNLSLTIVDTLDIYNFGVATSDNWNQEIEDLKNQRLVKTAVTEDVTTTFGFGDFIAGANLFFKILFRSVFISETLVLFGMDRVLAILVSLPVIFLYGAGIFQFVANRGLKGMS